MTLLYNYIHCLHHQRETWKMIRILFKHLTSQVNLTTPIPLIVFQKILIIMNKGMMKIIMMVFKRKLKKGRSFISTLSAEELTTHLFSLESSSKNLKMRSIRNSIIRMISSMKASKKEH